MGTKKIITTAACVVLIGSFLFYQHNEKLAKEALENYYIKVDEMTKTHVIPEPDAIKDKMKWRSDYWQHRFILCDSFIPKTKALREIHEHYLNRSKLESERYELIYEGIDTGHFKNFKEREDGSFTWTMTKHIVPGVGVVVENESDAKKVRDLGDRVNEELRVWRNKLRDLSDKYSLSERFESFFNREDEDNLQMRLLNALLVFPHEAIPKEEVSDFLPQAMCSKMIECMRHGGPTREDCEAALTKQVLEGKNGFPFPSITTFQLAGCVAGLENWTCKQMQTSTNPPTGCEFLAKK